MQIVAPLQGAKVDCNIGPHDPKWIRPLLSSSKNLHMKFESQRAKTVACTVPTRFHRQSPKVGLGVWPPWLGQNGVPPLQQLTNNFWKWSGKYCSLDCAHKVLHTVPKLTSTFYSWPKMNRVLLSSSPAMYMYI